MKNFLGEGPLKIAFIPFADVSNNYDAYTDKVRKGLGHLPYEIETVLQDKAKETIEKSDVIMVGGGNTFKLLHDIYAFKLLDVIRNKVNKNTPYIGWSAGSNILAPSISTTNDMPVIEPFSFNALGLLPFQINPHYTNATPPNHQGETRDQRLGEFIVLNPGLPVVGLPEGCALKLENVCLHYIGPADGVLFSMEEDGISKKTICHKQDLSFLL
jgi:dipeptidase E